MKPYRPKKNSKENLKEYFWKPDSVLKLKELEGHPPHTKITTKVLSGTGKKGKKLIQKLEFNILTCVQECLRLEVI